MSQTTSHKPAPVPTPVPSPTPGSRALTVGPTVALINLSTVVTDAQITLMMAALQVQVDRDFGPVWMLGANIVQVTRGGTIPKGVWAMFIMDISDEAGALGYHDLTPDGFPVGKVFAKSDLQYGMSISVTVSHELMEMLLDPYISNTVFVQSSDTTGVLYAYEVADAVEDDSLGYDINGILVSDFVTPAWFESFRKPNSVKFSFMGHVNAPFTLAVGGYIGVFAVSPNTTGWTQRFAQGKPGQRSMRKAPESRTMRRFSGKSEA